MFQRNSRRVAIIGAGPGGLASAMLLAARGCQVDLYERLSHVGGRTSRWQAEQFTFDLGPTFFLYPRILREIFAEAGFDFDREVPMVRLDPQYRLVFGGGGNLDCTPDVTKLQAEVARISPGDATQVPRFLGENRQKFESFRPFLESAFSSWRDLLRPKLLGLVPLLRPWNSLDRELQRYFADPRIRLAFSFQSKYLGMSPFQCPSLFSILSFLEYEYGVFHPLGGCGRVSEIMADLLRGMGVTIHLNRPVTGLEFSGKRAVGVVTDAGTEPCDALVVNADFAAAMQSLVPDQLRSAWKDRQIEKKRYSCSTFMLYLGVRGSVPQLPHHTIYLSENYLENLQDIELRHCLSRDPSIYVQNACQTEPGLAPPGCSTLYVLAPVTHLSAAKQGAAQRNNHASQNGAGNSSERHPASLTGTVNWERDAPEFRLRVLRQLEKLGIENLAERIVYERVVTPQDWQNDYNIFRGATFNLAHTLDQMLHLRPRNRFDELDSVYLVGGGTHPGSGLPVIYSSARISCDLLCQDLGIKCSSQKQSLELV